MKTFEIICKFYIIVVNFVALFSTVENSFKTAGILQFERIAICVKFYDSIYVKIYIFFIQWVHKKWTFQFSGCRRDAYCLRLELWFFKWTECCCIFYWSLNFYEKIYLNECFSFQTNSNKNKWVSISLGQKYRL
jgi:hypothetical protein